MVGILLFAGEGGRGLFRRCFAAAPAPRCPPRAAGRDGRATAAIADGSRAPNKTDICSVFSFFVCLLPVSVLSAIVRTTFQERNPLDNAMGETMSRLLTKNAALANSFLPPRAIFLCIFLCSCTMGPWEKEFWTPPPARGAAPITDGSSYPIPRASGENLAEWPSLGSVPDRTEPPLSPSEIDRDMRELERERTEALEQAARLARDASRSAQDSDSTQNVEEARREEARRKELRTP